MLQKKATANNSKIRLLDDEIKSNVKYIAQTLDLNIKLQIQMRAACDVRPRTQAFLVTPKLRLL